MTENDYGVKIVPALPNVFGVNGANDGKGRRKQKKIRRQPKAETAACKDEDAVGDETQMYNGRNADEDHVDYCA